MAKVLKSSNNSSIEVFTGAFLECIAFVERLGGVLIDENGFLWRLIVEEVN